MSDALALVSVGGQPGQSPASGSAKPASIASSAQLHKQLLAQEVAKVLRRTAPARARALPAPRASRPAPRARGAALTWLRGRAAAGVQLRKELATLKAQQQQAAGRTAYGGGVSEALKAVISRLRACRHSRARAPPSFGRACSPRCAACWAQARIEKERKEAEKAEVVAQANAQKQVLAAEVQQLQVDVRRLKTLSSSNPLAQQSYGPGSAQPASFALPDNVAEALARRKAFEETFSMTLRSLREELMDTSVKRLSSRSQTPQGIRALLLLSDERIDRIMDEALRVRSLPCAAPAPSTSVPLRRLSCAPVSPRAPRARSLLVC